MPAVYATEGRPASAIGAWGWSRRAKMRTGGRGRNAPARFTPSHRGHARREGVRSDVEVTLVRICNAGRAGRVRTDGSGSDNAFHAVANACVCGGWRPGPQTAEIPYTRWRQCSGSSRSSLSAMRAPLRTCGPPARPTWRRCAGRSGRGTTAHQCKEQGNQQAQGQELLC